MHHLQQGYGILLLVLKMDQIFSMGPMFLHYQYGLSSYDGHGETMPKKNKELITLYGGGIQEDRIKICYLKNFHDHIREL